MRSSVSQRILSVCCVLMAILTSHLAPLHAASTGPLAGARQLVMVVTRDWNTFRGELQRFERSSPTSAWRPVGSRHPIVLGSKGLAWGLGLHPEATGEGPRKLEGDQRSPAGVFRLTQVFGVTPGRRANNIRMPYLPLTSSTECVDDPTSRHYNRLLERSSIDRPDWRSAERMRDMETSYRWGVVVDHNTARIAGRGSCIFLHLWAGPDQGMPGCTAMEEKALLELIRWLDPAASPVLVQLPEPERVRLTAAWGLPQPPRGAATAGPPDVPTALLPTATPLAIPEKDWRYRVVASPEGDTLSIEAAFPAGSPAGLGVDAGAEPSVLQVELATGSTWTAIEPRKGYWTVPECRQAGCRIRYRFQIADLWRRLRDPDSAMVRDGATFARPPLWLLRPMGVERGTNARIEVIPTPDVQFVSGLERAPDGASGTYQVDVRDLENAPYSAFGRFRLEAVTTSSGARIELALPIDGVELTSKDFRGWAEDAGRAIEALYGRFPVRRLTVFAATANGDDVQYGTTMGTGGASIIVFVGRRTRAPALREDWVLVHEIIHLTLPTMSRRHLWLEEGLATYLEPIGRIQVGRYRADAMWKHFVDKMAHGQPGPGDRGLDLTRTWGRTYWGGALFCLVADVRIRERTGNRYGLIDAMRGILQAGGNTAARWDIDRTLAVGDRAVGVPVLSQLYQEMALKPSTVDLGDLWRRLGIERKGDTIVYDDGAPLAAIRRAISQVPARRPQGAIR